MIDTIIKFFKKLKPQERLLVIIFCIFILANIYFHMVYKPLGRGIKSYQKQAERLMARIEETKAKFPNTDIQKQRIEGLTRENKKYLDRIEEIQKNLPARANIPQLLAGFSRQAKNVKIISLRQKMDENEEYSRIFIEVKFDASYKETINYIKRLEDISPFLRIEEIELSEKPSKEKEGFGRMVFSTLLKENSYALPLSVREADELDVTGRDIFTSGAKTVLSEQKKKLKLEGITYNLINPTAIINGEVVKVDSQINGFTVKEIFPDKVIVNDGKQDYILEAVR